MDDIVDKLRKHVRDRGGPRTGNGAWQMMLDAADEIERLRHDIDRAILNHTAEMPDDA